MAFKSIPSHYTHVDSNYLEAQIAIAITYQLLPITSTAHTTKKLHYWDLM